MTDRICRRALVSGRVQGVFFRAATARRAQALGVRGHAVNLPDGRVEVVAWGERGSVEALCEWLAKGPPAARVEEVAVEEMAEPEPRPTAFTTA